MNKTLNPKPLFGVRLRKTKNNDLKSVRRPRPLPTSTKQWPGPRLVSSHLLLLLLLPRDNLCFVETGAQTLDLGSRVLVIRVSGLGVVGVPGTLRGQGFGHT